MAKRKKSTANKTINFVQNSRTDRELIADSNKTAKNTFPRENKKKLKQWANNPEKSDIWGVDTKNPRTEPGKSAKGKGWHEPATAVVNTAKGVKRVAPRHHLVATKKATSGVMRRGMVRSKKKTKHHEKPHKLEDFVELQEQKTPFEEQYGKGTARRIYWESPATKKVWTGILASPTANITKAEPVDYRAKTRMDLIEL